MDSEYRVHGDRSFALEIGFNWKAKVKQSGQSQKGRGDVFDCRLSRFW